MDNPFLRGYPTNGISYTARAVIGTLIALVVFLAVMTIEPIAQRHIVTGIGVGAISGAFIGRIRFGLSGTIIFFTIGGLVGIITEFVMYHITVGIFAFPISLAAGAISAILFTPLYMKYIERR